MSEKCTIDVVGVLVIVRRLEERIAALEPRFAVGEHIVTHGEVSLTIKKVIPPMVRYECSDGRVYDGTLLFPAPVRRAPLAERLKAFIAANKNSGSIEVEAAMARLGVLLDEEGE